MKGNRETTEVTPRVYSFSMPTVECDRFLAKNHDNHICIGHSLINFIRCLKVRYLTFSVQYFLHIADHLAILKHGEYGR